MIALPQTAMLPPLARAMSVIAITSRADRAARIPGGSFAGIPIGFVAFLPRDRAR